MTKVVRKLRHWKQRFDKNARFIWRRAIKYGGKLTEIGAELPEDFPPLKLKRFWEAGVIELAEFEDPNVATGQRAEPSKPTRPKSIKPLELPDGVTVERGRGSWLLVTVEGDEKVHRVNGRKALAEFLERLVPKEIMTVKQSSGPENAKQQPSEDAPGETAEDDDEHDEADAATVDGATAETETWMD